MQLSISTKPVAKVHLDGTICTTNKCKKHHEYINSLALKSAYTEGFTVKEQINPEDLNSLGFSSWVYAPTTKEHILTTKLEWRADKIDYKRGYRNSGSATALLRTHWQDYDEKLITIKAIAERWQEAFPNTSAHFLPSSSGTGVRILYDGLTSDEIQQPGYGEQILVAERVIIEDALNIQLDATKQGPSAHSGHLQLQGTYKVKNKEFKPEHPDYPESISYKAEQPQLLIDSIIYSKPLITKSRLSLVEGNYDADKFKAVTPTAPVGVKDSLQYTLPTTFILDNGEGKGLTAAELYIQVITASPSQHDKYASTGAFTASPAGAENSRPASTVWNYDPTKGVLYGSEVGQGRGEHLEQITKAKALATLKGDKSFKARRSYVMSYKPHTAVAIPKGSKEVAEGYYLQGQTLYRVVPIGTEQSQIIEKWVEQLNIDNLSEVYEYLIQTDKGFSFVPHNPLANLSGVYTTKELATHCLHIDRPITASEVIYPEDKIENENAKQTLDALDAFLQANVPMITKVEYSFSFEETTVTIDRQSQSLKIREQYHTVTEPEVDRPAQEIIDYYYNYARDHQEVDIKLFAEVVIARAMGTLPDGLRLAVLYSNAESGSGKSEVVEALKRRGIAPSIDISEQLAEGNGGTELSYYGRYLVNLLDEADNYEKEIAKFARVATSTGITGRRIYGSTENMRMNFLFIATHQGIKDYTPEFMDKQDKDRVLHTIKIDNRDYAEVNPPYSTDEMRAALDWCLYESFTQADGTLSSDPRRYMTSSDTSGTTVIALDCVCAGFEIIKTEYDLVAEKATKTNKYPAMVKRLKDTGTGLPMMAKEPLSRIKKQKGKDGASFTDGIYITKDGAIHFDSKDVLYSAVTDLGRDSSLKTLIRNNLNEAISLLGAVQPTRTKINVDEQPNFFSIAYMPLTETQLRGIILGNIKAHPKLADKSVEELMVIYTKGARSQNVNMEQMAEVAIAYYLLSGVETKVVKTVETTEQEDLF